MNPINPILIGRPNYTPNRDLVDMTDEGPVVKLGIDLEFYTGDIFLKPKHIIQIAKVIGMVSKEELEIKDAIIGSLKEKIIELENATGEEIINGKLDNILGYLADFTAPSSCSCAGSLPEESEDDSETEDQTESEENKEDPFTEDTELSKSLLG